ncbi:cation:proton antiporter [Clostridium sp. DJ247]|uniref:cation:proton antiporter n=1 Tax=Clostridium sp. DJ247 TaxID=2726188 RepID=UPI00162A0093|nr:cation:proton antiporter [Clostridium sp. DJ247]MBC2579537.1 cation:proton antiporter [Clostridium sp. DJ247]
MEKILLDLALILICTKIGGLISKHFKMPEVLGALVAGVILGPSVLNLIHENSNIELLSTLGVVVLMFLAGLETNLEEFKKAGLSSLVIACGGILIPLIFGTLSAYFFFNNLWENLFLGVILTATSVTISVQTLTELGKLNTRAGINILGAAVIDDILGLILVSVILAIAPSSTAAATSANPSLLLTFIKIIVFCVVSIIAIVYLPKHLDKYTKNIQPQHSLVLFSVAIALIFAFIAESLGIAAITGAYIFGLLLSSLTHKEYIQKRVNVLSAVLLSPIFFANVGISANIQGLNLEVIFITLAMFLVAVLGKLLGCSLPARLMKMKKSEAIQIGIGMISRGEVALITANIGLQKGIISEEIFLPTIIVVILTTIITPVLLKISFSHKLEKSVNVDN